MSDNRLRDLERRWRETGAQDDEARYMAERIRCGLTDTDGLTNDMILVFVHRLIEAGLSGKVVAGLLARSDKDWASRLVAWMTNLDAPSVFDPFGPPPAEEDFAEQEVESDHGYPPGFAPRSPLAQLAVWRERYPHLDGSHVEALSSQPLPAGAEGWLVVPKAGVLVPATNWQVYPYMAAARKLIEDFGAALGGVQPGEPEIYQARVESPPEHTPWCVMNDALSPGEYTVVPCQFGLRHRGQSANRAEYMMEQDSTPHWREQAMGLYDVLGMLITQPALWQSNAAYVARHFVTAMPYFGLTGGHTVAVGCTSTRQAVYLLGRDQVSPSQVVPSWFLRNTDPD